MGVAGRPHPHKGHKGPHPGAQGKHHPHKGVHVHHKGVHHKSAKHLTGLAKAATGPHPSTHVLSTPLGSSLVPRAVGVGARVIR